MAERLIIQNAIAIAEQVAAIILRDSYRFEKDSLCVRDVLLFGSTLRRKPAHDIDLLLLHDHLVLGKFGPASIYDEKIKGEVPDPNANLQEGYNPVDVLEMLGSKEYSSSSEDLHSDISDDIEEQCRNLKDTNGNYQGSLDLPCLGNVEFKEPVPLQTIFETVNKLFDKHLHSKFVLTKVNDYMESQKYSINALDLQLIHIDLLRQNNEDGRGLIVKQCTDPTFWHTVLSTGRLYNQESEKFDTPVNYTYPGATQLFPR